MQLTSQNYHSNEANRLYMSNSQYKDFMTCESMTMAKINGEWSEEPTDALLIGSYVDAWLEGTLEDFKVSHPELFSTRAPNKGELKSQYQHANVMIDALQKDAFCQFIMQGQKQTIMTAEFAGVMWKAKFDVYAPESSRIVDLKTVKSIRDKHWSKEEGRYVSFVEAYGYIRQLALYAEIERIAKGRESWCEPLILAVSKEEVPDIEVIGKIEAGRTEYELEEVSKNMPRIIEVKSGAEPPARCESCKHCRSTKVLSRIVHYSELVV